MEKYVITEKTPLQLYTNTKSPREELVQHEAFLKRQLAPLATSPLFFYQFA